MLAHDILSQIHSLSRDLERNSIHSRRLVTQLSTMDPSRQSIAQKVVEATTILHTLIEHYIDYPIKLDNVKFETLSGVIEIKNDT